jgi:fumarate reductase flavoprotein subunit
MTLLQAGAADADAGIDVLIAGGGLAGFAAACAALEGGARVALLEKQPDIGGSTVISGGAMAFAGTDEQRAAGVEDTDELLRRDLRHAGEDKNDPALVDAYVAHQLDTYRWLKHLGVVFKSVQLGGGHSVPRSNRVDTKQLVGALRQQAQRSGRFRLVVDCAIQKLARNGDGSWDVHALLRGQPDVVARGVRAVVLATGGFSRSEEWLSVFAPAQSAALRIGGRGNTGDGLRIGMSLGANLRDMGHVKGTFGVHPDAGTEECLLVHPIFKGAIAVNLDGRRFVDESVSYKISGDAVMRQREGLAFQIFDEGVMALSVDGVVTSDFRGALRSGHLYTAATLHDLARQIGVDGDALAETVARYNGDVGSGRDRDFGRDGLSNHYGALRRIDQSPFYAYPSTSAVLATYAGLAFDAQGRVIDVYGQPIAGLYAAGEVTGGFHGAAYMTGSSLGKSAIFGRIAGTHAAAYGRQG